VQEAIRIGAAGSIAARCTAPALVDRLRRAHGASPSFEIRTLSTPVADAVLAGEVDVGLVTVAELGPLPEGLVVAAVLQRADARDGLVLAADHEQRIAAMLRDQPEQFEPRDQFAALPSGSRVGSVGARHSAMLRGLRPDLVSEELEADPLAAVAALQGEGLDAVIVDCLSLDSLEPGVRIHRRLKPPWMPVPGQGVLVLLARAGEAEIVIAVQPGDHRGSRIEVEAEMTLLQLLADSVPLLVRAHASREGERLRLAAMLLAPDGSWAVRGERQAEATRTGAVRLARRVARDLLDRAQAALASPGADSLVH